ncbi:MAG: polysaccharide pyruvyl transferase family protein [Armatimonadota bacterium]|nr:polysaccharide pyruvyl transferase family protein [Armatimonadota bacterium]
MTHTPRILLCSAWQIVNIGDIAHTPAALALLERHFPEAQVTLWPFKPLTPAATDLLMRRFPRLQIVAGEATPDGEATPELARAMDEADFFLHGSGPATLGWARAEAFQARTGRGFGVYGVTYGLYGTPESETLSRARFVYFRDSLSLERAKSEGISAPIMEWSPDVAFAFDIRDDERAAAFLGANSLQEGEFVCCIPRFRNTPFWELHPGTPFDPEKQARNDAFKTRDHAPLREAIVRVACETNLQVLICPEDQSQIALGREQLFEPLPDDVKKRVVLRDRFWLPDEALATYEKSAGLFGCEMHSPIMCVGNGVPAIVCRFAEQSTKGLMWRDIGLGEWLFDLDDAADLPRIAPTVLAMAQDPKGAKQKAAKARHMVFARYAETMGVVKREVLAARGEDSP